MVGQCKDTLRLGTAGILGGWALQGYLVVGQCKDTLRLGTAGILGGLALQGYLVVGHESQLPVGRATSTLKSNNPTARVGNYKGDIWKQLSEVI